MEKSSVAIILTVLILLGAVGIRIFFGVDFTDESLYVALPYRFILGDKPFADELSTTQTAGIIIKPALQLFCQIMGSSDGIVLFTRGLHYLLSVIVAALTYFIIRPYLKTSEALLTSLLPVMFIPFNIQSLSYNTLASLLLQACLFLSFHGLFNSH